MKIIMIMMLCFSACTEEEEGPSGSVTLRAVNAAGEPVADVAVSFTDASGNVLDAPETTDASGEVTVAGAVGGNVSVVSSVGSSAMWTLTALEARSYTVVVSSGEARVNFTFDTSGSPSGAVSWETRLLCGADRSATPSVIVERECIREGKIPYFLTAYNDKDDVIGYTFGSADQSLENIHLGPRTWFTDAAENEISLAGFSQDSVVVDFSYPVAGSLIVNEEQIQVPNQNPVSYWHFPQLDQQYWFVTGQYSNKNSAGMMGLAEESPFTVSGSEQLFGENSLNYDGDNHRVTLSKPVVGYVEIVYTYNSDRADDFEWHVLIPADQLTSEFALPAVKDIGHGDPRELGATSVDLFVYNVPMPRHEYIKLRTQGSSRFPIESGESFDSTLIRQ